MVGQYKMRLCETWDWGIEWIHLASELRKWVSSFEKVISPQFQKNAGKLLYGRILELVSTVRRHVA